MEFLNEFIAAYVAPVIVSWFASSVWSTVLTIIAALGLTALSQRRKHRREPATDGPRPSPWSFIVSLVLGTAAAVLVAAVVSWITDTQAVRRLGNLNFGPWWWAWIAGGIVVFCLVIFTIHAGMMGWPLDMPVALRFGLLWLALFIGLYSLIACGIWVTDSWQSENAQPLILFGLAILSPGILGVAIGALQLGYEILAVPVDRMRARRRAPAKPPAE